MNIAELGVKIDSADAIQAKTSLDEMAKAGGRAEQSAVSLMNEMQALEKSLSTSAKTTQDLAKQRDALAKLTKTGAYGEAEAAKISAQLDKQQIALAKSAMDEQKALNSLLGAIDPARGALAKLDTQVEQLGKHLDAGRISQDQYNTALSKIDKDYAKLEKTTTGFDRLRLGTRQAQENVVQLGNALSSGDWGSGVRAVAQLGAGAGAGAAGLLAILGPLALATAAVGGLAVGYYKGSEEQDKFRESLVTTGNAAGTTSSSLAAIPHAPEELLAYEHSAEDLPAKSIWWQGEEYAAWPVQIEGISSSSDGTASRPTFAAGNINGRVTALCLAFEDMLKFKLTVRETLAQYLDAANYPDGNPTADPTQEALEIWYIDQKTSEDGEAVVWELSSPGEIDNHGLPGRQMTTMCHWSMTGGYRGPDCNYTGTAMFDDEDVPTDDPAKDECKGCLSSCKLRFGEHEELNFGGFPAVSLISRS